MATSSENQATASESAAENETLTLKSSNGDEFILPISTAVLSSTIKNMVEDGCAADAIPLPNVDAKTLCKIIPYLKQHAAAAAAGHTRDELKKFDDEFFSGESFVDLMDTLMAANYLNIRNLIELLHTKIAVLIQSCSVEEVREKFNISPDDILTAEKEEDIRKKYPHAFEKLDEV